MRRLFIQLSVVVVALIDVTAWFWPPMGAT